MLEQFTEEELKNEQWKPIPHYEEEYEVSNLGRVRTKEGKTTFTQRHGKRHWQQRILKQKKCSDIQKNRTRINLKVNLWKNGRTKTLIVARLVISAFDTRYDLFGKMTVNHIDNNSTNNRLENLEWCSMKENIQKGFDTGAFNYPRIKITDKRTNEEFVFRSKDKASLFLGQNHGYISDKLIRGKTENLNYKWEVLK